VPDFFIIYQDKNGKKHAEMVEVKPASQTTMEYAGKSLAKKKQVVINMAKWEAANAYARQRKIKFRVVSEEQLFHNGKRK
jgi:Holliday junction resolvase-like predicted endonuclease